MGPLRPSGRVRRRSDPCAAGLDLLRWQVLFITGALRDPDLAATAPAFGIDPEFWGPGCAAYALRRALGRDSGAAS
jgi:hypothetical protein